MSDAPYSSEVPEQLPIEPEASPPNAADTMDTTDAALDGAHDAEARPPPPRDRWCTHGREYRRPPRSSRR